MDLSNAKSCSEIGCENKRWSSSIWPKSGILNKNPVASKTGQKMDLTNSQMDKLLYYIKIMKNFSLAL